LAHKLQTLFAIANEVFANGFFSCFSTFICTLFYGFYSWYGFTGSYGYWFCNIWHLYQEDFKFGNLLNQKKQQIIKEGKKTSSILKEFSKLLGNLDQNNNVFYLIFGNGYFLRGLATSYQIEKWIVNHGLSVKKWFEIISLFDAYISLGTFAFNHPQFAFPELIDSTIVLKSNFYNYRS